MNKMETHLAAFVDCPAIQKLWPFYIYDLGRECGSMQNWEWPTDSAFVPEDFTPYFIDPTKKAFLIKVDDELAGFALVTQLEVMPEIDYYLNDFFILAKFQNKGIGKLAAIELFNQLKGQWAVGVIPDNKKALIFWRKILTEYTAGDFTEHTKTTDDLKTKEHPNPHPMVMFCFESKLYLNKIIQEKQG